MAKLLEVKNLKVSFRQEEKQVNTINGVSFTLNHGETLGIVGESGCGKSVTSLSVMGLLPKENFTIEEGEIWFDGKNLLEMTDEEYCKIRGKEIAMIFQEPMTSLNPVFTIGNQLIETIMEHSSLSKKDAFRRGVEMLKKVGIPRAEEIMSEYPHRLSGGMRQRVMIAMAMVLNPKLLIADEPTTALDVTIQAQILDLMRSLKKELHTAIIMITHDLGVVAEICDRVAVMYAGEIVEEGGIREIFKNPKHPYTLGLFQAMPSMREEQERLYSIPGSVPTPDEMPIGCRFAPRCEHAKPECHVQSPKRVQVGPDHSTCCWLYSS
ncbi:oligopeptide ABC transporter (ATP-binding protein) [[Clostridium] ultunense Esp]|nr:oligopeptide ABC transporter (ATP-binding protein) [[Clostridium] ultunense Esp]